MRHFTLFFAIYLLILACLPCADTSQAVAKPLESSIAALGGDASENHHVDWCSPLCQCSCCAGTYLPTDLPAFAAHPARSYALAAKWALAPTPACRNAAGSVWQPPQA